VAHSTFTKTPRGLPGSHGRRKYWRSKPLSALTQLVYPQDTTPPSPFGNPYYALFDVSPDKFPWRKPVLEAIKARRVKLSGKLIFDLLLSEAGILQPEKLFPPVDAESLKGLLDAIANSGFDQLKKSCLVYCLLQRYRDGRDEKFAADKCIAPQFITLVDAYCLLDAGRDLPVCPASYRV
jgi:hypothetical protein